jgi:hypothetical protein
MMLIQAVARLNNGNNVKHERTNSYRPSGHNDKLLLDYFFVTT